MVINLRAVHLPLIKVTHDLHAVKEKMGSSKSSAYLLDLGSWNIALVSFHGRVDGVGNGLLHVLAHLDDKGSELVVVDFRRRWTGG